MDYSFVKLNLDELLEKRKSFHMIVLGPPGVGKTTIARELMRNYKNVHLISASDIIRNHKKHATDLGKLVGKLHQEDKLVPDLIMTTAIKQDVRRLQNKNWIMEGYPRNLKEAKELSEITRVDMVLNLTAPIEECVKRLEGRRVHPSSGRVYHTEFLPPKTENMDDETKEPLRKFNIDDPEVAKVRYKTIANLLDPVVTYYQVLKLVKNVRSKSPQETYKAVNELVKDKFPTAKKIVVKQTKKVNGEKMTFNRTYNI